jgi:enolase
MLLLPLPVLHDTNTNSASSFSEALRMGAEVYHNLKNIIKDK